MSKPALSKSVFPEIRSLLVGVALVTGISIVVYFVVVQSNKSRPTVTDVDSAEDPSTLLQTDSTTVLEPPHITSLEDIVSTYSTWFNRNHAFYGLVAQSDEDDLTELFSEARNTTFSISDAAWVSEVKNSILTRLLHVNRAKAITLFDSLPNPEQSLLATEFFKEWSRLDLDSAVTYAESYIDLSFSPADQFIVSHAIIDGNKHLSRAEFEALGARLRAEDYTKSILNQALYEQEAQNPEQSWSNLLTDPNIISADPVRVTNIVLAWVEQEGISILDEVLGYIKINQQKENLIYTAINAAAKHDLALVFDYIQSLGHDQYGARLGTVIYRWAESDPNAAWDRILLMESKSARDRAQEQLLGHWARENPDSLQAAMPRFSHTQQDLARVQLALTLAYDSSFDDAKAVFSQISDAAAKQQSAQSLIYVMGQEDPAGTLAWISSDPDLSQWQYQFTNSVLSSLAFNDPIKAFELALEQPLREDLPGFESNVVTSVAYTDMDKAIELLPKVREGKTKIAAYNGVGNALASQQKIDEAIELGRNLSSKEQEQYYTSLGSMIGMMSEADETIDLIGKLPSDVAKSKIAMSSISMHEILKNSGLEEKFDEEQIEELREYLNEEDAAELEESLEKMKDNPAGSIPFLGL